MDKSIFGSRGFCLCFNEVGWRLFHGRFAERVRVVAVVGGSSPIALDGSLISDGEEIFVLNGIIRSVAKSSD